MFPLGVVIRASSHVPTPCGHIKRLSDGQTYCRNSIARIVIFSRDVRYIADHVALSFGNLFQVRVQVLASLAPSTPAQPEWAPDHACRQSHSSPEQMIAGTQGIWPRVLTYNIGSKPCLPHTHVFGGRQKPKRCLFQASTTPHVSKDFFRT